MERVISKQVRAYDNWILDAESKAAKVWLSLKEVEESQDTQAVASKVQHDLDVARGRRTAMGHVLGYDSNSDGSLLSLIFWLLMCSW